MVLNDHFHLDCHPISIQPHAKPKDARFRCNGYVVRAKVKLKVLPFVTSAPPIVVILSIKQLLEGRISRFFSNNSSGTVPKDSPETNY